MGNAERHAVVLGASMGGLLAARALVGHYERVTLIERDTLPADTAHRRGVPQARHFHALLLRGAQVLDRMFPGLVDDLVDLGAVRSDFLREARFVVGGHQAVQVPTGARAIQVTRPVLEGAVRDRVAGLPGVKIVDDCDVVGPVAEGGRVTGVRVAHRGAGGREEVLPADLVVDATGRAGRTAAWLAELGYRPPVEERVKVDMAYASRLLRLPAGVPPPDKLTLVGPVPGRPTGFAFAAQEGDRWMLTAVGMAGQHPPVDEAGLLAFVRRAAPPDLYQVIAAAEPLSEPRVHKYMASTRRRYERLREFPEGLLVFGDAFCSFNPIYGQGMTVAALEAEALRRCLRGGDRDLARRFFRAAARIVDPVWRLNVGGDLALPEIEGHRPLATRVVNRYIARLQRVATRDAAVATAFIRVIGLLDPPWAVLAPAIAARVLVKGSRRGPGAR